MIKLVNKKYLFIGVLILLYTLIPTTIILAVGVSVDPVKFTPQVTIPNSEFKGQEEVVINGFSLINYVIAYYKYGIGVAGILGALVMMYGGTLWLTAGDSNRVNEAKEWIKASLTGTVLLFCAFLLLSTINPALVTFKPLIIPKLEKEELITTFFCCEWTDNGIIKTEKITTKNTAEQETKKQECKQRPSSTVFDNQSPVFNYKDNRNKCVDKTTYIATDCEWLGVGANCSHLVDNQTKYGICSSSWTCTGNLDHPMSNDNYNPIFCTPTQIENCEKKIPAEICDEVSQSCKNPNHQN